MIPGYEGFKNLLINKNVKMQNPKFDKTIQKFHLLHIPLDNIITNQQILEYIDKSEIIIMDTYTINNIKYLICCITSLIIIINPTEEAIINSIYSKNKVYNVPKKLNENFMKEFGIHKQIEYDIKKFWSIISPSIATYLIEKSYLKTCKDRIYVFIKNIIKNQIKKFNKNEFIELKSIGQTNSSLVSLCYHIEKEKLYAIKTFYYEDKLKEREMNNYMKIKYPFIPKYYGKIIDSPNSFVIEYINGQTFQSINEYELDFNQKVTIIIELLHTFQYLHNNNYVYRDLKLNNLILDKNGHIVLIDFDRMRNIKEKIENEDQIFTNDFNSDFVDPKINKKGYMLSFQNDIYSIGKFIQFIFAKNSDCMNNDKDELVVKEIVTNCLKDNLNERPSLSNMIMNFGNLENKISLNNIIEKIVINQNNVTSSI